MEALIIHPLTEQQLTAFVAAPSHALAIIGPSGSGKGAVAHVLASRLLALEPDKLELHPYFLVIRSADGKAISIETIRGLEHFLSRKVPTEAAVNRIVIIEDAELLSQEAQNALLKTLEEPPEGTVLLITVADIQALLPTVRSRLQQFNLILPSKESLVRTFTDQTKLAQTTIEQAFIRSGGLPGLMQALLLNDNHPLASATNYARELLQSSQYERLKRVDELAKSRPLSQNVCFILEQMARLSLQSASGLTAERWFRVLESSYLAEQHLKHNGQIKLVLTNLMLNLT